MSTNINISVGDNKLLEQARLQQNASRQAQLEKEATQRLEAQATDERTKALAAAGKDANGNPLYGVPSAAPSIDRRPAANRFGQGLDLGHLWAFGDIRTQTKSTGIGSAQFNGNSFTVTDSIRGTQNDLLLGCGDGGQWETFADVGTEAAPPLPADTFSVGRTTTREIVSFVFPPTARSYHAGRRKGGSTVNTQTRFFETCLPCGRGNFIFIYGFASIWDAYETEATYAAEARYQSEPPYDAPIDEWPFIGYLNPSTGVFDSPTVPDRLPIFQFVESTTIEPVSFTGYRGKQRRFAAYVCNNSSIREIAIPSAVQPLLDAACPEPADATQNVFIYGPGTPEGNFVQDIYTLPNPTASVGGNIGLRIDVLDAKVFTPAVFQSINNAISFTDPINIKTIPEKLFRGLADRRDGTWAAFQDTSTQPEYPWMSRFYREGAPFYYALWPNKNEEPNLQVWDPAYAPVWASLPTPKRVTKATLNLKPDRVARNGANDDANFYGPNAYNGEKLFSVWDWDDPGYCRSMCLALGFTAADLTP